MTVCWCGAGSSCSISPALDYKATGHCTNGAGTQCRDSLLLPLLWVVQPRSRLLLEGLGASRQSLGQEGFSHGPLQGAAELRIGSAFEAFVSLPGMGEACLGQMHDAGPGDNVRQRMDRCWLQVLDTSLFLFKQEALFPRLSRKCPSWAAGCLLLVRRFRCFKTLDCKANAASAMRTWTAVGLSKAWQRDSKRRWQSCQRVKRSRQDFIHIQMAAGSAAEKILLSTVREGTKVDLYNKAWRVWIIPRLPPSCARHLFALIAG